MLRRELRSCPKQFRNSLAMLLCRHPHHLKRPTKDKLFFHNFVIKFHVPFLAICEARLLRFPFSENGKTLLRDPYKRQHSESGRFIPRRMTALSADIIIIIVFASILLAFMAFMLIKSFWQRSSIARRLNLRDSKNERDSPFERA